MAAVQSEHREILVGCGQSCHGGRPVQAHHHRLWPDLFLPERDVVHHPAIREEADKAGITKLKECTTGGATRQESVINGIRCISKGIQLVAIHDGARPLVKPEHIEKVIKDASVFGGATLGVPVKDTIKTVDGGLIIDTPPRSSLYITQTPQIFKRDLYFEGVDFALEHGLDFTDDCQLVEAIGGKVAMTVGDYTNIKITTPEDIKLAEVLLKL